MQLPHRKQRREQQQGSAQRRRNAAVLHEKTDPRIARQIEAIFNSPLTEDESVLLHTEDEGTSWFGIDRGPQGRGPYLFKDYGRYEQLMTSTYFSKSDSGSMTSLESASSRSIRDRRTPNLVSVVGASGAGKSMYMVSFALIFQELRL
jgi:hypothetical protein